MHNIIRFKTLLCMLTVPVPVSNKIYLKIPFSKQDKKKTWTIYFVYVIRGIAKHLCFLNE